MSRAAEPLYARCEYCIFYDRFSPDYGYCRHWSPQLGSAERVYTGGIAATRGEWPMVCNLEWCGQFKAHPEAMDAPPPVPDPAAGVLSTVEDLQAAFKREFPERAA